jgi:hypothetical protein
MTITSNVPEHQPSSLDVIDETALRLKSQTRVNRLNRTVTEKLQAWYGYGELDLSQMFGSHNSELALRVLRRLHLIRLSQEEKIFVLGIAAALHRPENGYQGRSVRPDEVTDASSKVWKYAINKLRKYQKMPRLKEEQYNRVSNNITYKQRVENANLATDILSKLSGPAPTAKEDAMDMFNDAEFQMLCFEVLPPGVQELVYAINNDPNSYSEKFERDRAEFMIKLAAEHPGCRKYKSRISLQRLDAATTDKETGAKVINNYYILEFPLETQEGQTSVVFADNFMSGNAIFIVREDIHVAGTWREILSLPRSEAKELCTRIEHRGNWQDRVREALK